MALAMAIFGRLYDRVQNVSQNLTKEKVKNELAWMAGNAAICGAAKILTAATLATVTPAAIATAAGIVVGGVLATSIRHIKEHVDVDAKKEGNTDSRFKLAIRHLNRAEIWDHMKTSQFRTRLLLNWGVSIGTFGLLEGTDIGHTITEHAGKAIQKTAHWLSDRANAAFSMFHRGTQLDLETIQVVPRFHPAAEAATTAAAPAAPAAVDAAAPAAIPAPPTPAANASNLIAKNGLRTPQQIKDYAYTLLNGKNGVTADPETAIELYKISATAGNKQAIENLRFLASQKQYKDFGLADYLENHPAPATHTPATGTAGTKSLTPTKSGRIRVILPAPTTAAHIPPAPTPTIATLALEDRAPTLVATCTSDVSPERVQAFLQNQGDNVISVHCDSDANTPVRVVGKDDSMILDGTTIVKSSEYPETRQDWLTRMTAKLSSAKWNRLLRNFTTAAANLATQQPTPDLVAAASTPTDLAPQ